MAAKRPTLVVSHSDLASGIDTESLLWTLDGAPLDATCSSQGDLTTCELAADFTDGSHELGASIADTAGNRGFASPVTFQLDSLPPVVAFTAPADEAVLTSATPTLSFTWSDAGSGLEVDAWDLQMSGTSGGTLHCPYNSSGGSCTPLAALGDGLWTARLSVPDLAANSDGRGARSG
jgi:hypothetical protein